MKQHRLFVLATWSTLLIGLLIYPGTSCRFLAYGNVVGYWPIAGRGDVFVFKHENNKWEFKTKGQWRS